MYVAWYTVSYKYKIMQFFFKKHNNFTHFFFVNMIFLNSIPTFMSGRLLTGI